MPTTSTPDSNKNSQVFQPINPAAPVFDEMSGTIEFDPANPAAARVEAVLSASSINTNNEKRDGHLESPDFFDVANHPQITFTSNKVEPVEGGFKVHGDLTIRGVTKPTVLDVELLGAGPHAFIEGAQIAGFTARTKVNRQDFGIKWNKALDTGGAVLGDDVDIEINIEAIGVFHDTPKIYVKNLNKAVKLLQKLNYIIELRDVLLIDLENRPGDSAGFGELAQDLTAVTRRVNVGKGLIQAMPVRAVLSTVAARLETDPFALLCDKDSCLRCNAVRETARFTAGA